MHFANDAWSIYLLPAFLALAGLGVFTLWRDKRDLALLGHQNLGLSPAMAWTRRLTKSGLVLGALGLALLGALRAQGKPIPEELSESGIDVMVVLDTSKSMLTEDLSPNRLEAAKKAVLDWMGQRTGDRVGLTVFAGEALTQVPLTLDLQAVSLVLEQTGVDAVDLGGTDIGKGLQTALEAFPKDEPKRGKAILLFTDGEPTSGASNYRQACQEAKAMGVPVVTVGMGTRRGREIPDGLSFWGEPQYKKDAQGNLRVSRLDEETLERIADLTEGLVVHGDSAQGLKGVGEALEKLQRTTLRGKGAVRREELAPALAAWSAGFLMLGVLL